MTSSEVFGPHLREIAQDAEAVHLGHHVMAEVGKAAVAALVAARAHPVLGVVGHLDDADAEFVEQRQIFDAVLDGTGVLPAEDDARLVLALARRMSRWCRPA